MGALVVSRGAEAIVKRTIDLLKKQEGRCEEHRTLYTDAADGKIDAKLESPHPQSCYFISPRID